MADERSKELLTGATIIKTRSVMDICLPVVKDMDAETKQNWDIILDGLKENFVLMQFVNLYSTWKTILFSMFIALVLSIAYIYFLSLFAEYVAWGLIFFIQTGLIGLSAGSFYYYTVSSENGKSGMAIFIGIISGILSLAFCLLVYFGWS